MSDSASRFETRAAIEAQVEFARRTRAADKPGLGAWWPVGVYLCLVAAIMAGVAINSGLNSRTDPSTTAALQRDHAPLRDAAIVYASPTMDLEEVRRRLCTTGEVCEDVTPVVARSKKLSATAQLPGAPKQ